MDTGLVNKPLFPVSLPDEIDKQIHRISEENFRFEDVVDTKYDGRYNVMIEFDTRPMKTYAFQQQLMSREQDREDGSIITNLLASVIKNIRVFKLYENEYNYTKKVKNTENWEEAITEPTVYEDAVRREPEGVSSIESLNDSIQELEVRNDMECTPNIYELTEQPMQTN